MKTKKTLLIIPTLALLLLGEAAVAQSQSPDPYFSPTNQFSCTDELVVGEGVRTSKICPKYEKKNTCAGEQDVPLRITITGQADLKLLGVSLAERALGEQPVPITFTQSGKPTTKAAVPVVVEYSYKMNISREARARKYQVRLELRYPNDSTFSEYFWLKVCSEGGIKISDDSAKVIKVFTGGNAPFQLKLSNSFEQYPINLREITITSTPADLIEPGQQVVRYSPYESIKLHDKPFNISIKIATMSLTRLFYGFDDDSKITLGFVYDDGESEHELADYKEIKLSVRPSVTVLLVAILSGVLLGSLIKMYMRRLPQDQVLSKEQIGFIIGTAFVGMVLSLVALFGEVQVVAFKLQGSYDNPRLLFIVSLGVTIIGLPLIETLFKLSKSGGSPQGAQGSAKNEEEVRQ